MITFTRDDPSTWPDMKPIIIAHDVARSHDRSWAARHPHLPGWVGTYERSRIIRKRKPAPSSLAWT